MFGHGFESRSGSAFRPIRIHNIFWPLIPGSGFIVTEKKSAITILATTILSLVLDRGFWCKRPNEIPYDGRGTSEGLTYCAEPKDSY
jgi:hypothetical protein